MPGAGEALSGEYYGRVYEVAFSLVEESVEGCLSLISQLALSALLSPNMASSHARQPPRLSIYLSRIEICFLLMAPPMRIWFVELGKRLNPQ